MVALLIANALTDADAIVVLDNPINAIVWLQRQSVAKTQIQRQGVARAGPGQSAQGGPAHTLITICVFPILRRAVRLMVWGTWTMVGHENDDDDDRSA